MSKLGLATSVFLLVPACASSVSTDTAVPLLPTNGVPVLDGSFASGTCAMRPSIRSFCRSAYPDFGGECPTLEEFAPDGLGSVVERVTCDSGMFDTAWAGGLAGYTAYFPDGGGTMVAYYSWQDVRLQGICEGRYVDSLYYGDLPKSCF